MEKLPDTKKPADKPVNAKKLKQETAAEKKNRKSNEEYKKKYFGYYDDVKISDRQDW